MESAAIVPAAEDLMRAQGAPPGTKPSGRSAELCKKARALFAQLAVPRGLYQDLSRDAFATVYRGDGLNAEPSPLAEIAPRAPHLALFALTLGEALSHRIVALFSDRDFALAALLDAAASEGAERAADALQAHYEAYLAKAEGPPDERCVLRYSPGYCGWDVSGQRALFAALAPGEIGLTLRASCLMEPLKSISGVLVGGPAAIHRFDDEYEFCADCGERACRERIARLNAF